MALITRKTTKILGVLSLVVITAGAAVGLGVPTVNNIMLQAEEVSTTEEALATLTANRDTLLATEANYPNVREFSEQMLVKFPELAQTPELLTAMQQAAAAAGIGANSIPTMTLLPPEVMAPAVPEVPAVDPAADSAAAPAADPAAEGETPPADPAADPAAAPTGGVDTSVSASTYARIPIEVSILGGARELQVFMDELHGLDRAILVDSFTVVNAEGENLPPGTKTLQFTGSTYVYSKIPTPDEVAAAPATDPNLVAPNPTEPAAP